MRYELESFRHALRGKQLYDAIHFSRNLKIVCYPFSHLYQKIHYVPCLGVNLRTVKRIKKQLDIVVRNCWDTVSMVKTKVWQLGSVYISYQVGSAWRHSKMRKGQFLSQAMRDKTKNCAAKLLTNLKHHCQLNMLWFFSDEKNFYQDQMLNS